MNDDNPCAEALMRTAKWRPAFPAQGFAHLEAARIWAASFMRWTNHEHRRYELIVGRIRTSARCLRT